MKRIATMLSVVVVLVSFVVNTPSAEAQTASQNAAARALYNAGRDLMDDGKLADAEKKFREVLASYPKSEQADDTSYYLITTLAKLGKVVEARAEIDNFRKNYPQSTWKSDVEERRIALGSSGVFQAWTIPNAPAPFQFPAEPLQPFYERLVVGQDGNSIALHLNDNKLFEKAEGIFLARPGTVSLDQEILRVILEKDPDRGIELAQERLKADPSDPAVISNLSTIANSSSPKALPFIMSLAKTSTVPNVRTQSLFWMSRKNGDKDAVVKALMELLATSKDKEMDVAVANTIAQFNANERRAALDQIAQGTTADRLGMLERIYKNSNNTQLRTQIVQSVAPLTDARALSFLGDAAKNDRDMTVRRAAVQALATRKEPEALRILEDLLAASGAKGSTK